MNHNMTKMAVGMAVKHFRLEILFVSKTTELHNTHFHKLTGNIPVHLVLTIVIVNHNRVVVDITKNTCSGRKNPSMFPKLW